jgi:hypothetical protein
MLRSRFCESLLREKRRYIHHLDIYSREDLNLTRGGLNTINLLYEAKSTDVSVFVVHIGSR